MRTLIAVFGSLAVLLLDGSAAAQTISLPSFQGIQLQGPGAVEITRGAMPRVLIKTGSNDVSRFSVDAAGLLTIDTCEQRCPPGYRLEVEIQIPAADKIAVSGAGRIVVIDPFLRRDSLAVSATRGGTIDARMMAADTIMASADGDGTAMVMPLGTLFARVRGGGAIRYLGNPTVFSHSEDGRGSINRMRR